MSKNVILLSLLFGVAKRSEESQKRTIIVKKKDKKRFFITLRYIQNDKARKRSKNQLSK